MNWAIHHVNLQVHDMKEAVAFYKDIVGLDGLSTLPKVVSNAGIFNDDPDHVMVFGDPYRGLHLITPMPTFGRDNKLFVNPSIGGHVAFNVNDLGAVKRRLESAAIPYSEPSCTFMNGYRNIYLYDPSANFIEINETND